MIKIENVEVVGLDHAIRGMRNPKNSWDKIDSYYGCAVGNCDDCDARHWEPCEGDFIIGKNDNELMMKLANAGRDHAKYRRMIVAYLDITAPLYWWKEFDTYKVGTVSNSCSTMHKIHDKELTLEDFSHEHLNPQSLAVLYLIIERLNVCRVIYLADNIKEDWWQMIQLLPSSYNQKRTIMLNYEVLANIYNGRRNHKLDEWREFCEWVETLPSSHIITSKATEESNEN